MIVRACGLRGPSRQLLFLRSIPTFTVPIRTHLKVFPPKSYVYASTFPPASAGARRKLEGEPRKDEQPDDLRPETIQKPGPVASDGVPKTDALLTEQTMSNKEQRKADWAIMKEMARYLWPKVCKSRLSLSVALTERAG